MATKVTTAGNRAAHSCAALLAFSSAFSYADCSSMKSVAGDWYYPGGDAPPMTITLHENGELTFAGGFLFYSPGRWRYSPTTCELTLAIPAMKDWEISSQNGLNTDGLVSTNVQAKELIFRIALPKPHVIFMTYYFFKLPESSELLPSNEPLHPDALTRAGERQRYTQSQ